MHSKLIIEEELKSGRYMVEDNFIAIQDERNFWYLHQYKNFETAQNVTQFYIKLDVFYR